MIGHGEIIHRSGIAAYLPPCISTLTNHKMKGNLSVILRNQRWRRTSTTPPLVTLHSHCAVRWNGFMGEWFAILCGVRQGGVLSPYLFSVQFMSMIWFLNSGILVQAPTLVNCLWDVCYMLMMHCLDVADSPSCHGLRRLVYVCSCTSLSVFVYRVRALSAATPIYTRPVHTMK